MGPNPKSPIPNPQSPIPIERNYLYKLVILLINNYFIYIKLII